MCQHGPLTLGGQRKKRLSHLYNYRFIKQIEVYTKEKKLNLSSESKQIALDFLLSRDQIVW